MRPARIRHGRHSSPRNSGSACPCLAGRTAGSTRGIPWRPSPCARTPDNRNSGVLQYSIGIRPKNLSTQSGRILQLGDPPYRIIAGELRCLGRKPEDLVARRQRDPEKWPSPRDGGGRRHCRSPPRLPAEFGNSQARPGRTARLSTRSLAHKSSRNLASNCSAVNGLARKPQASWARISASNDGVSMPLMTRMGR